MEQAGMTPDVVTFLCVLKACAGVGDLVQGRRTHSQLIRMKVESSACSNSLIDMYAKCGSLDDALCVFDRLRDRSVVSWGAIIAGHIENGDACLASGLFKRMKKSGVEPNRAVFLCLIKACIFLGKLGQGMLIHHEIIKDHFDMELMVGNALMDMYVKFFCLDDALKIFDKLPHPDVVSWDIRIVGLADNGRTFPALDAFEKMQVKGLKPDKYTYSCILKACAIEGLVCQGMLIHDQILKRDLENNVIVSNTLIDMYGKCGYVGEACKVFNGLARRDVVSWGTVMARCVQHGFDGLALEFFERILQDVLYLNKPVFVCASKACGSEGTLMLGRLLHDQMIRSGLEIDLTIGTTLVNMYGMLGGLEEASHVFIRMKVRNEVTWGLLLAGYVQHHYFLSALRLFVEMQSQGINPEKTSIVNILKGCGKTGAFFDGRLLHGQALECGLIDDIDVGNTLIDMYAKCGSSRDSLKLLEGLPGKNASLWAAKIALFASTGCLQAAQESLMLMDRQGFKPDQVVFLSLLSACTSTGLLEEGCEFFASMRRDYGLEPGIDEYTSVVDLLGRAGRTREAEDLLETMPLPSDISGWMSLLSSCRASFNIEMARSCFDQIVHLDPNDASAYVLMSSIYADAHMWDDVIALGEQFRQASYM